MFESFARSVKNLVDDKILRHFRESHHPLPELGLASAVGLFWGLTPLVGIQMILVTANWALFRAFRLHFHLVIGVAWVWLSNPFTMVPLYYSFYITGYYFFALLGQAIEPISAAAFSTVLDESAALGMVNGLIHWMKFMIYQLGWPMLVGGFVLGVPAAIAGYPLTIILVRRFRMRNAARMGISYAEWEERYVLHRGEVARFGPAVEDSHSVGHESHATAADDDRPKTTARKSSGKASVARKSSGSARANKTKRAKTAKKSTGTRSTKKTAAGPRRKSTKKAAAASARKTAGPKSKPQAKNRAKKRAS